MKNGDDFAVLLTSHLGDLYRFAWRLTRHKETAEDLVQDLFVSLDLRSVDPETVRNPRAWLSRILYCRFVEHWRRENRSPVHLADTGAGDSMDDMPDFAACDHLISDDPGPETQVENAARQALLQVALDQLSGEHRDILLLHDVEGYSFPELETIMAVPVGTLKSRLHRARNRLQALLENMNFFERDDTQCYPRAVK